MTTIAQWEAFAEATVTGDEAAKRIGRELAAQTPPIALARRARHRKPNRRPAVIAKAAGTLALVAAIGGSIAAGHHAHHGQASAPIPAATVTATLTARHAQPPAQKTCAAFRTWEHAKTPRNLARLVTASTTLPRGWLKADAGQLYADASSPSPKAAKYLGDDATHVNQDCGG